MVHTEVLRLNFYQFLLIMNLQLNILNFITDDKFLDNVILNHDSVVDNVEHYYAHVIDKNKAKDTYHFKYIKKIHRIILLYPDEILSFLKTKSINAIILHSLYSCPIEVTSRVSSSIPILWNAWGYDIYQLPLGSPLIKIPLYKPLTIKCVDSVLERRRKKVKHILVKIRDYIVSKGYYKTKQVKNTEKVLARINYFSGIIDMEYQMMKQHCEFKAEESVYIYGSFSSDPPLTYPRGNKILLGNSANPTNNHLDILTILTERGIDSHQVITPLNYGGEDEYIAQVMMIGEKYLGSNYKPLTDFLAPETYFNMINSCSSIIIGTMRQQAMGNIAAAFTRGVKVFLFRDSILYKYLQSKGYLVYTIEDDLTKDSIDAPLTQDEAKYNYNLYQNLKKKKWNNQALQHIYTQFRDYIAKNMG